MDQAQVGKAIAALRRREGLTQTELGERLGVTNKTVSRWENGNYMPDISTLESLSGLFGLSIDDILSCRIPEKRETQELTNSDTAADVPAEDSKTFTKEEKLAFFKKKWLHEHMALIVLAWGCFIVFALYVFANARPILAAFTPLIGGGIYAYVNNKMCAYAEKNIYQ